MDYKEKGYVSVVCYLQDDSDILEHFMAKIVPYILEKNKNSFGEGQMYDFGDEELKAVERVIKSQRLFRYCESSECEQFEREFAAQFGVGHSVLLTSGTNALIAALSACGIGPGDEVIRPAYTCVVVPNAILYRGARPVYVDIEPKTLNIDVAQIQEKITPRTKAINVQHTFGLICDIEAVKQIAQKYDLPVLEDCAHALGATTQGRSAGSLGTAAYFSTDHSKIMSTGTGGVVTTNDETLAEALASIYRRSPFLPLSHIRMLLLAFAIETVLVHPRVFVSGKYLLGLLWRLGLSGGFFHDELSTTKPTGYPYPARLSNAQARIGLSQLALLKENLQWRRRLAEIYESEIGAYGGLLEADYANHAFLRYTFMVEKPEAWEEYFKNVLDMSVWFTSVAHGRERDFHEIGYQMGSCPVAEAAAMHSVNLPTHPRMRDLVLLTRLLRQACHSDFPALKLGLP